MAGIALAEVFTVSALAALFGVFFSPVLPAAAVVMSFAGGFFYSRSEAGQRQRLADAAFGRRVSGQQMRALVDGNTPLDAAGLPAGIDARRRGNFQPSGAHGRAGTRRVRRGQQPFPHTSIAETLVEKGGTLAACDGEGVRVLFGAPLPVADHAAVACRADPPSRPPGAHAQRRPCARDVGRPDVRRAAWASTAARWPWGTSARGGWAGSARRARRWPSRGGLCAANLIYGSTVLVGARTFEMAESAIEARPLELLRRRLGDSWHEVYELLGEPQDLTPEELSRRDLFWTGVIFYREKRLGDALEKFSQARPANGKPDEPLDFYIRRIKGLQHGHATTDFETARLLNSL